MQVPYPLYGAVLLFYINGASLQSTSDQVFTRVFPATKYVISDIRAVGATGGVTVACAGGIYNEASKGGDELVAATQDWTGITAVDKVMQPSLESVVGTDVQTETPILSLTTGSTAAATANIYIYGYSMDV